MFKGWQNAPCMARPVQRMASRTVKVARQDAMLDTDNNVPGRASGKHPTEDNSPKFCPPKNLRHDPADTHNPTAYTTTIITTLSLPSSKSIDPDYAPLERRQAGDASRQELLTVRTEDG